jgi:acetate kinase
LDQARIHATRTHPDHPWRLQPYDPEHQPRAIELIEAFRQRHPQLPPAACFDTAFHRTMPRVAKVLPIPRRLDAKGIPRHGFHGLSSAYLLNELARLGERSGNFCEPISCGGSRHPHG